MSEPKKRGRPARVDPPETRKFFEHVAALAAQDAEIAAIKESGADLPSIEDVKAKLAAHAGPLTRAEVFALYEHNKKLDELAEAQAYANRVWSGCSVSLPDVEKEKIVREALAGQGWTMEGIHLP